MLKKYKFEVNGLTCPNCARKIEDKLKQNDKLNNVVLNFANLTLAFESDEKLDINSEVVDVVTKLEPNVKILDLNQKTEDLKDTKMFKDILILVVGIVLAAISILVKNNAINTILIILSYILLMYKTFLTALKKLKNKIIDESMLICISAIGAYLVNKPLEGMMVLALYDIGKILEARAVSSTRKSIKELMNILNVS